MGTSLGDAVWVAIPILQLITVAPIEMDVAAVLPAWSECASQQVLEAAFTVTLAVLAAASLAIWAHHSSTNSILFVQLSCQFDWDIVFFSPSTLKAETKVSTVTTARVS